jgi:hypothetical protein
VAPNVPRPLFVPQALSARYSNVSHATIVQHLLWDNAQLRQTLNDYAVSYIAQVPFLPPSHTERERESSLRSAAGYPWRSTHVVLGLSLSCSLILLLPFTVSLVYRCIGCPRWSCKHASAHTRSWGRRRHPPPPPPGAPPPPRGPHRPHWPCWAYPTRRRLSRRRRARGRPAPPATTAGAPCAPPHPRDLDLGLWLHLHLRLRPWQTRSAVWCNRPLASPIFLVSFPVFFFSVLLFVQTHDAALSRATTADPPSPAGSRPSGRP